MPRQSGALSSRRMTGSAISKRNRQEMPMLRAPKRQDHRQEEKNVWRVAHISWKIKQWGASFLASFEAVKKPFSGSCEETRGLILQ